MLEGLTGWPSVFPETRDFAILKIIQDKLIKQGHRKITLCVQPTKNFACYSNKREKLYGRYCVALYAGFPRIELTE